MTFRDFISGSFGEASGGSVVEAWGEAWWKRGGSEVRGNRKREASGKAGSVDFGEGARFQV